MQKQSGFTLIELMIAIAILGIVVSLGIPSFAKLIAENRVSGVTNEFNAALQVARSEAVRRGTAVSIRSVGGAETFQGGWNVFAETATSSGSTGSFETGDTYIREAKSVGGTTTISRTNSSWVVDTSDSTRMYFAFNSRGASNSGNAAYFKICDSSNTSIKGRGLSINVVGKISLDSSSLTCP